MPPFAVMPPQKGDKPPLSQPTGTSATAMTYYLADIENIADRWRGVAQDAQPGDVFLLFHTGHIPKFNPETFAQASLRGISFRFIKCYNKRENALDFQLAAYMGMLFASNPDASFVILSRDGGYDPAILLLRDMGADIRRFPPPVHVAIPASASRTYEEAVLSSTPESEDVSSKPEPNDASSGSKPPERQSETQRFIDSLSSHDRGVARYYITSLQRLGVTDERELIQGAELIYDAMKGPPNARRASAYKAFLRKYGVKDGQARYRSIKDFVAELASNGPFPETEFRPERSDDLSLLEEREAAIGTNLIDAQAALEKSIASACPELTEDKIAEIRAAMADARRINPKHPYAGYGAALMAAFPDREVKKTVYERTKALLPGV